MTQVMYRQRRRDTGAFVLVRRPGRLYGGTVRLARRAL